MKLRLTVAQRLLGSSAIAIGCVLVAGAVGYWLIVKIGSSGAEATRAASAIKTQMQADQSHDALRADVMAALVAGSRKDAAEEKAVKSDLGEHGKLLRDSMQTLRGMGIDAEVDKAVAHIGPALDVYLASANATASLAFTDPAEAQSKMAGFTASFKAVEKEMAVLSDLIEERAKRTEADSEAISELSRRAIIAGAVVAGIIIALMGVLNCRHISRQLGGEPDDVARAASAIAAGDLTTPLDLRHATDGSIVAAMSAMQESLRTVVASVRRSSDSIATGSTQIASGNVDLSQRTEEQAASLEQTAASMDQLNATVRNSADTARTATELAGVASAAAAKGGEVVGHVVSTMDEINAGSKKIADIIGVIDGIAFQTNILALNAAVEAARAGEQGRGFAVVASEVRSLAQRSAQAAKEIKGLIGASVERVEAGTKLVGDAGATMNDIVSQVKRVSDLIGEISAATIEQTSGIGQINGAVNQLDRVTQQNAALVEEGAAAADSLRQQAQTLVEVVSVFKLAHGEVATVH